MWQVLFRRLEVALLMMGIAIPGFKLTFLNKTVQMKNEKTQYHHQPPPSSVVLLYIIIIIQFNLNPLLMM